jgi:tyrosyl-tRNA synthetase
MLDATISWAPLKNWVVEDTRKYLIDDDLLLFRKGKHNVRIVQIVSDEEYALSGECYPGMPKEWRDDVLKAMAVKEQVLQSDQEAIKALDKNVLSTNLDSIPMKDEEPEKSEKSATHPA